MNENRMPAISSHDTALRVPLIDINLCPCFRYVSAHAKAYLEEFRRARCHAEQQFAIERALELSKLIVNVIAPLSKLCQPFPFADGYDDLARRLQTLARRSNPEHDTSLFPWDDRFGLINDKLDALSVELHQWIEAHQRRQSKNQKARAA